MNMAEEKKAKAEKKVERKEATVMVLLAKGTDPASVLCVTNSANILVEEMSKNEGAQYIRRPLLKAGRG